MKYEGKCHCGNVSFEIETDEIKEAMTCNCTICIRKGHMLTFLPRTQMKFTTPESNLSTYLWNKKTIAHQFCKTCGVATHGFGKDPNSGVDTAAVNVRCLEGIDLKSLKINEFDGRHLL